MEKFRYRKPAKTRRISEIKVDDEYVKVVGLIVDKRESEFILDDGSGRLTVFFEDPSVAQKVKVGSKVRVFGVPSNIAEGYELRADIIQNVHELDLGLYQEVRREIKKFEIELERGG